METNTQTTQTTDSKITAEEARKSLARALKAKKAAEQKKAAAQNDLNRAKQDLKKLDAHYKILLSGWIIAAAKISSRMGAPDNLQTWLAPLKAIKKMPPDLEKWLADMDEEINKIPKPNFESKYGDCIPTP